MKKLKFIPIMVCMIMLTIALTGCSLFESKYKSFKVQYTEGLQLLLGEEWHDDLIKGTATKSDDTEEDVTSKMTIDTSEYKKDQVGKYKIYFEFEDSKLDYEVEVVTEITNSAFITNRVYDVVQNSLVAKDGVLSFDATMTQNVTYDGQTGQFKSYMYYRENNSEIDLYYKWESIAPDSTTETIFEIWYEGTVDEGVMTLDYNDDTMENESGPAELLDVDIINATFASTIAEEIQQSINYIDVEGIQELQGATIYAGSLTKNNDLYTLTNAGISMTYSNNKLMSINSINFAFDTEVEIPNAPEVL